MWSFSLFVKTLMRPSLVRHLALGQLTAHEFLQVLFAETLVRRAGLEPASTGP